MSVPLLYTLHEVPVDSIRWTARGLRSLAFRSGEDVAIVVPSGERVETVALLVNWSLAMMGLTGLQRLRLATKFLSLLR